MGSSSFNVRRKTGVIVAISSIISIAALPNSFPPSISPIIAITDTKEQTIQTPNNLRSRRTKQTKNSDNIEKNKTFTDEDFHKYIFPKLDLIPFTLPPITITLNSVSTGTSQSARTIANDLNEVMTKYYEVKLNELVSDETGRLDSISLKVTQIPRRRSLMTVSKMNINDVFVLHQANRKRLTQEYDLSMRISGNATFETSSPKEMQESGVSAIKAVAGNESDLLKYIKNNSTSTFLQTLSSLSVIDTESQLTNQPTNQPSNQSSNQVTNQPTNQITKENTTVDKNENVIQVNRTDNNQTDNNQTTGFGNSSTPSSKFKKESESTKLSSLIAGYTIVCFSGISLLGWCAIFYLRRKNILAHRRKIKARSTPSPKSVPQSNSTFCSNKINKVLNTHNRKVENIASPHKVYNINADENAWDSSSDDSSVGVIHGDDDTIGRELALAVKEDEYVWTEIDRIRMSTDPSHHGVSHTPSTAYQIPSIEPNISVMLPQPGHVNGLDDPTQSLPNACPDGSKSNLLVCNKPWESSLYPVKHCESSNIPTSCRPFENSAITADDSNSLDGSLSFSEASDSIFTPSILTSSTTKPERNKSRLEKIGSGKVKSIFDRFISYHFFDNGKDNGPPSELYKSYPSQTDADPEDTLPSIASTSSSSHGSECSSVEKSTGGGIIIYRNNSLNGDEENINLLEHSSDESDQISIVNSSNDSIKSIETDDDSITISQRGFYVIDEENDLVDEFISKDEFDAAVRSAADIIAKFSSSKVYSGYNSLTSEVENQADTSSEVHISTFTREILNASSERQTNLDPQLKTCDTDNSKSNSETFDSSHQPINDIFDSSHQPINETSETDEAVMMNVSKLELTVDDFSLMNLSSDSLNANVEPNPLNSTFDSDQALGSVESNNQNSEDDNSGNKSLLSTGKVKTQLKKSRFLRQVKNTDHTHNEIIQSSQTEKISVDSVKNTNKQTRKFNSNFPRNTLAKTLIRSAKLNKLEKNLCDKDDDVKKAQCPPLHTSRHVKENIDQTAALAPSSRKIKSKGNDEKGSIELKCNPPIGEHTVSLNINQSTQNNNLSRSDLINPGFENSMLTDVQGASPQYDILNHKSRLKDNRDDQVNTQHIYFNRNNSLNKSCDVNTDAESQDSASAADIGKVSNDFPIPNKNKNMNRLGINPPRWNSEDSLIQVATSFLKLKASSLLSPKPDDVIVRNKSDPSEERDSMGKSIVNKVGNATDMDVGSSQLSHYRRKYTENDPNYPRQLGVSQQVSESVVDGDIISPSSLQMNKRSMGNILYCKKKEVIPDPIVKTSHTAHTMSSEYSSRTMSSSPSQANYQTDNNKKSQNNVIMSEFLTKLNVKAIKVNQSLLPTFSKLNKRNDTSTLERLNNDNFDDGKQDAKSLIGMFEQNRSETSSAIFPQSEHWQYVGKEKS